MLGAELVGLDLHRIGLPGNPINLSQIAIFTPAHETYSIDPRVSTASDGADGET